MITAQAPYKLYYWPLPFRGHFIRFVLSYVEITWEEETDPDTIAELKMLPCPEQPVPFMAPPLLYDRERDFHVNQLQAIMGYLGRKHGLMPDDPVLAALTDKVLGDCGDVLEELTCNCGEAMWSPVGWADFSGQRLPRWMQIFEELGRRHGLSKNAGTLLGTPTLSLADLATAALWHPMCEALPGFSDLLQQEAPLISALTQRVVQIPQIERLLQQQHTRLGTVYCGGEIEKSIRLMLDTEGLQPKPQGGS